MQPRRRLAAKAPRHPTFSPPPPARVALATPAAPWATVPHPSGTGVIPYLLQTTVANAPVRANASSDEQRKTVRYLLVTHSDGGLPMHEHGGFDATELSAHGTARHTALLCQLGKALAKELGISTTGDTWDVLAQLPQNYSAYYRARIHDRSTMDLHILGYMIERGQVNEERWLGKTFFSVKQFSLHLAWLSVQDDRMNVQCECKNCEGDRGGKWAPYTDLNQQVNRKTRWTDSQRPLEGGVPDWRV